MARLFVYPTGNLTPTLKFAKSEGTGAKLYDARNDPQQERALADLEPETVVQVYVLKDVSLPD